MIKTILYFFGAVLCILIPFYFTSYETLDAYWAALALFYGVLFGVLFTAFAISLDKTKSIVGMAIFGGIIATIIFFIKLLNYTENLRDLYFEKNGVYVEATILNGVSEKKIGERNSHSLISLSFTTKDSQDIVVVKEIHLSDFKGHYKNESVPIIYSKLNPKEIRILYNIEDMEKWIKKK